MKSTLISVIAAVVLIGGAFMLVERSPQDTEMPANNVSIVDGKQIIEIGAKGGFQPRKSVATAGIPTVLKFETNGTFDCSSTVRIPSMKIATNLPPSGSTDIDIGSPRLGTLQGTCGMGMYPFEVEFKS